MNHAAKCPIVPRARDAFTLGSVSEINCCYFSAVRVCERVASREQLFFAECVPGFEDDVLADLVKEEYRVVCLRICPSVFGLPITRDRKYMFYSTKL